MQVAHPAYKVLFLCTGNSARSIFAESILNHLGTGRFEAYSAGSSPRGQVHPLALRVLQEAKLPSANLRSKGWDDFAAAEAPQFDFIITVCDAAAGESCPVFAGHTVTAHWGIADPAAVEGSEEHRLHAFRTAFRELDNRIREFISLPLRSLDRRKIQEHLDAIGSREPAEVDAWRIGRHP